MARTREDIKKEMTVPFMANVVLSAIYGFGPGSSFEQEFSILSLENIIFEIMAMAIMVVEQKFDFHSLEVDTKLLNQKHGRLPFYRTMALAFQYGHDLITDKDFYDNTAFTDVEIENSKIIKYAAVEETEDSLVILKIAGETNNVLSPISAEPLFAIKEYFKEVRPAGVSLNIINFEPDRLYVNLKIYRDPLVLNAEGQSILNANFPVDDAIDEYMKELPFNGEFIIAHFVDKLQKVPGVKIPHVLQVQSSWIDPTVNDYGELVPVDVKTIPVSGYFTVADVEGQPALINIEYVV